MNKKLLTSIFTALCAALIAAGAFIVIPAGPTPVPIVMQNMFAVLAGCLLGGLSGGIATIIFVFAGCIGLPVFSGGRAGFAHLLGPTGGFLIGYIFGAILAGLILGKPEFTENTSKIKVLIRTAIAAVAGFAILYVPGVIWFMYSRNASLGATMAACVIPFIPGDLIKIVITVLVSIKIRPIIARYTTTED